MTGYDNIEHASLSDVGVRRSHNQDACAVLLASDAGNWRERGHVFIVADGMGAHAVGELASELAVGIIPHTYHKHSHEGAVPSLRKSFIEANASIHARGQQNREFEGMGTTATALVVRAEGAWIGHVGDSRAYRIRGGMCEQLSFDHSLVWEYARRQRIDPDSVQGIPTNVIVRSLGPEPLVQVDIEGPHPVRDGDVFVLCSDGLSGQVADNEIGAVATALPPDEACRFLVDLANLRGGPDNITVIVARIGGSGQTEEAGLADTQPRRRWYHLPWHLNALLAGVLLATGAVMLTVYQLPGDLPAFLLATATIIAGMIGLGVQYSRDRLRVVEEVEHPKPRVHRRTPCRIDRALLDKLVRATLLLKQRAVELQWDVDWTAYAEHENEADRLIQENDLAGGFREYCRAMGPLAESLHRQRQKEEIFQPVWDKDREGPVERVPRQLEAQGTKAPYSLRYSEGVWEKLAPAAQDSAIDLALRGTERSGSKVEDPFALFAVLVLPRQNDLKDASAAALAHLEARQKDHFPGTRIEPVAEKNGPRDGAVDVGSARGQILKLHVMNGPNRERFVLLAVVQRAEQVLAVHAECDWQRRTAWEREMQHVMGTLRIPE